MSERRLFESYVTSRLNGSPDPQLMIVQLHARDQADADRRIERLAQKLHTLLREEDVFNVNLQWKLSP